MARLLQQDLLTTAVRMYSAITVQAKSHCAWDNTMMQVSSELHILKNAFLHYSLFALESDHAVISLLKHHGGEVVCLYYSLCT